MNQVLGQKDDKTEPTVTTYLFDEALLHTKELKVLTFDGPTAAWAEFIVKNRHSRRNGFRHDYDIVCGPVANDGVYDQIRRYELGRITSEELAEELKFERLNNQYYFGTHKAISFLKKI